MYREVTPGKVARQVAQLRVAAHDVRVQVVEEPLLLQRRLVGYVGGFERVREWLVWRVACVLDSRCRGRWLGFTLSLC